MSNETKRDVFVRLAGDMRVSDYFNEEEMSQEDVEKRYKDNIHNYDAALPDDLPTLPRIIGEYLKYSKRAHNGISFLFQVGNHAMSDYRIAFENWAFTGKSFDEYEKGDTFARAWVLGSWRVEETGETVKLEAEK